MPRWRRCSAVADRRTSRRASSSHGERQGGRRNRRLLRFWSPLSLLPVRQISESVPTPPRGRLYLFRPRRCAAALLGRRRRRGIRRWSQPSCWRPAWELAWSPTCCRSTQETGHETRDRWRNGRERAILRWRKAPREHEQAGRKPQQPGPIRALESPVLLRRSAARRGRRSRLGRRMSSVAANARPRKRRSLSLPFRPIRPTIERWARRRPKSRRSTSGSSSPG